jgi:hypothetical protein
MIKIKNQKNKDLSSNIKNKEDQHVFFRVGEKKKVDWQQTAQPLPTRTAGEENNAVVNPTT